MQPTEPSPAAPAETCKCGDAAKCIPCNIQSPEPVNLEGCATTSGVPLQVRGAGLSGLGLFTTGSSIKKGQHITSYGGPHLHAPFPANGAGISHWRSLYPSRVCIDGSYNTLEEVARFARHHHLASLTNAPQGKEQPNVVFYEIEHRNGHLTPYGDYTLKSIGMKALREIGPRTELLVDYGSGYWKNRTDKL